MSFLHIIRRIFSGTGRCSRTIYLDAESSISNRVADIEMKREIISSPGLMQMEEGGHGRY